MEFADASATIAANSNGKQLHAWWDERQFESPELQQQHLQQQQQHLQQQQQQQHHYSAASASVPALSARLPVRMSPSPCPQQPQHHFYPHHQQQQQQQHQQQHQQHGLHRERSTTSSTRVVSPHNASAAATVPFAAVSTAASEVEWLNQQLSDMQRLRNSLLLGGLPARASACLSHATASGEDRNDNHHQAPLNNAPPADSAVAASSLTPPCRHRRQHRRERRHRRHRRHQRARRRQSSFSSSGTSSEADSADQSSDASSASSSASASASCTSSMTGSQISDAAAAAATAASTIVSATSTSRMAQSQGDDGQQQQQQQQQSNDVNCSIESVYASFLSVSQRLNSLIAEYYSGSSGLQQPPTPPSRQVSLLTNAAGRSRTSTIYQGEVTPMQSSLILPSPLKRSMSTKRKETEMLRLMEKQPQPQQQQQQQEQLQQPSRVPAAPLRPLPPPPPSREQQQQEWRRQQQQQQQQQQPLQSGSSRSHQKSSKSSKKRHRNKSEHKSEIESANNKTVGFGRRIRASLIKKLSPRLRRLHPDVDSSPTRTSRRSRDASVRFNAAGETAVAAAEDAEAAASSDYRSQHQHQHQRQQAADNAPELTPPIEDIAALAASLTSPVPLSLPDQQSADACLAKLQRLRVTIVDLVQRSVDPVLKSLRSIQSSSTGSAGNARKVGLEVSTTLSDVMSLMELLSRSVMLVSMHNLDPNSLKLVYLSSSYIRSLKRLGKGLQAAADSAPTSATDAAIGIDEAAGDAAEAGDEDRASRLEL